MIKLLKRIFLNAILGAIGIVGSVALSWLKLALLRMAGDNSPFVFRTYFFSVMSAHPWLWLLIWAFVVVVMTLRSYPQASPAKPQRVPGQLTQ